MPGVVMYRAMRDRAVPVWRTTSVRGGWCVFPKRKVVVQDQEALAAALSASSSSTSSCTFCTRPGHTQATCRTFANAQKRARDYVASGGSKKRQEKSKKAEETAATSGVTEFAGNASAVPDLTDPSSPIQPHADFRWNAD